MTVTLPLHVRPPFKGDFARRVLCIAAAEGSAVRPQEGSTRRPQGGSTRRPQEGSTGRPQRGSTRGLRRGQLGGLRPRKHGTTGEKPVTRFLDTEAAALRALPPTAFDRVEAAEPLVREGGHVRFQNKQYSVGTGLKGQKVLVLGTKSKVSHYHKGCFKKH